MKNVASHLSPTASPWPAGTPPAQRCLPALVADPTLSSSRVPGSGPHAQKALFWGFCWGSLQGDRLLLWDPCGTFLTTQGMRNRGPQISLG